MKNIFFFVFVSDLGLGGEFLGKEVYEMVENVLKVCYIGFIRLVFVFGWVCFLVGSYGIYFFVI